MKVALFISVNHYNLILVDFFSYCITKTRITYLVKKVPRILCTFVFFLNFPPFPFISTIISLVGNKKEMKKKKKKKLNNL